MASKELWIKDLKMVLSFFRVTVQHRDPYWQEQWPYLRADPVRWFGQAYRNWRARPELHRKLDDMMSRAATCRRPGETDAELFDRIEGGASRA